MRPAYPCSLDWNDAINVRLVSTQFINVLTVTEFGLGAKDDEATNLAQAASNVMRGGAVLVPISRIGPLAFG